MKNNKGRQEYGIFLNNDQLRRDAMQSKALIQGIGDKATVESSRIDNAYKRATQTIAALGSVAAVSALAKELYNFANAFDKSMREVSTISETVTDDINGFKASILDMTTQIPVSADAAAKALYQIISAGHDGASGMNVLEVSAKAAVGGVTETATAADAITTILNSYGLSGEYASEISDQLFTTVRLGKTTFGELGQSVSQVIPLAASFGISSKEVLAAVASITKTGTPTAQAMTQIRAAIQGCTKAFGDSAFEGRTLQETFVALHEQAKGSATEIKNLTGTDEALAAILKVTGQNARVAATDLAELSRSAGATDKAFEKMKDGAESQLTILKNSMLAKFHDMGKGAVDIVGSVAKFLNSDGIFNKTALDDLIATMGVLITTLGVYKASLLITNAVGQVQQNLMYTAHIAELQKLIAVKEIEKNADLQKLVANKKLSTDQALKITQLREEVNIKLQEMQINAAKAAAEVRNAKISIQNTGVSINASRQKINALRLEQSAVIVTGNATKANALQEAIYAERKELSALKTSLKTQQTALGTLQENASTKAIAVNTFQQNANNVSTNAATKAKGLMTIATGRLTNAFHSLKLAFASNPLGLLLTGITLAISALTMFGNKTKEATDSISGFILKSQQEKSTFEELKKAISQTTEGTEARAKVIKLINERYPDYISSMLTEKSTTEDIVIALTNANEKMLENIGLKIKQTKLEGILSKQLEKESQFMDSQVDYFKNIGGKTPEQIAIFTEKMAEFVERAREGKTTVDDAKKALIAFGEVKPEQVEGLSLGSDGSTAYKVKTLLKWSNDIKKAADEAGSSQKILDALLNQITKPEDSNKKKVEASIPTYGEVYEKAKSEWEASKKELEKIEKDKYAFSDKQYNDAKERYNKAKTAFDSVGGGDKSPSPEDNDTVEANKAYGDAVSRQQKQLAQEEFELKRSATTDKIALIELERDAKLEAIAEERKAFIAQGISTGLKEPDINTSIFDKRSDMIRKDADNQKLKEQQITLDALLAEYQDYFEKINAIEATFAKDEESLNKINSDRGGNDEQALNALEVLKQRRQEEIDEINILYASKEEGFLNFCEQIADFNIDQLRNTLDQAQQELNKLDGSKDSKAVSTAKAKVATAQTKLGKAESKADKAPEKRDIKQWQDLKKTLDDVAGSFEDIGKEIGGVAGESVATVGSLATTMVSMIDGILTFATTGIDSIKTASGATAKAIKTVEAASVILAVISAAIQVAMKIAELFSKDKELSEETIKSYEVFMQVTDDLIKQQKELLETLTGVQAVMASKEALEIIQKQVEATRTLGKEYLASRAKNKHSYGVKTWDKLSNNRQDFEGIGIDFDKLRGSGRAEGLFDLSEKQLKDFREKLPLVWAELDDETRKYLDGILGSEEKMAEIIEMRKEALTGISLDDARGELEDFLNDTEMTMENVAENFEDSMKNAINRIIVNKSLSKGLEEWYENFATAMSDDALSEQEKGQLKREYEAVYKKAQDERDAAYEIAGLSKNLSEQQSATSRSLEAISQDTGSELSGRFAAMVMLQQECRNIFIAMKQDTGSIINVCASIGDVMRAMQSIALLQLEQLMRIGDGTDHLKEIDAKLNKIATNTSRI